MLKDLKQRTGTFVTRSIERERQAALVVHPCSFSAAVAHKIRQQHVGRVQAQGVELNAESAKRGLEAEIAALRSEVARAAAAQKAAAASFELQLNIHQSEVRLCTSEARTQGHSTLPDGA